MQLSRDFLCKNVTFLCSWHFFCGFYDKYFELFTNLYDISYSIFVRRSESFPSRF